jgi:hypothetical protein
MTSSILASGISKFSKTQLEAIYKVLSLLDPEEFRDYHDQFGVCNAPDSIEILRNEVKHALQREKRVKSE